MFCGGMELRLHLKLFNDDTTFRDVCGTCGFFGDARGLSAPSCFAFIHRVAFEEVSGHRVLLKCGPGNRGLSACCTTHELHLEFPREIGLILRCPRNPFLTKQGNRHSCRDQKGRRGSDEVVPGTSVVPSSETDMSRHF